MSVARRMYVCQCDDCLNETVTCVSCGELARFDYATEHVDDGTWCCHDCIDLV